MRKATKGRHHAANHHGRGMFGRRRHGRGRGHGKGHGPMTIYTADPNKEYVVKEVPHADLLPCLGIYPQSRLRKNYRYRMGGPTLITVGNRQVAVGKDIASKIVVSEVE